MPYFKATGSLGKLPALAVFRPTHISGTTPRLAIAVASQPLKHEAGGEAEDAVREGRTGVADARRIGDLVGRRIELDGAVDAADFGMVEDVVGLNLNLQKAGFAAENRDVLGQRGIEIGGAGKRQNAGSASEIAQRGGADDGVIGTGWRAREGRMRPD